MKTNSISSCVQRRLGAFVVGLALAWSVPAIYSVHSGLPYNPIKLPFADRVNARLWAPQGWKFFTRDPQEEQLLALVRVGAEYRPRDGALNASRENFFGASRRGRAAQADAGTLASLVPQTAWHDCKDSVEACLAGVEPMVVHSPVQRGFLCGDVALTMQKPVPWAWSRSSHPVRMPMRAARLEVQC